jgi:Grx4 family monothiol glutaredoxin
MVKSISSKAELNSLQAVSGSKIIIFFWAEWHEPSKKDGQMQGIFEALSQKYPSIEFRLVEAEEATELSEYLDVSVVPTFFTFSEKNLVENSKGANPSELSSLVKRLNDLVVNVFIQSNNQIVDEAELLKIKLEKLINSAPVMLFMKGFPATPRCGFSKQIVEILNRNQIPFASFDILTDESVRSGLKTYSDWPTYPQLYSNGVLLGGLDIIKEMESDGSLKHSLSFAIDSIIQLPPAPPSMEERLKALINQAPVMLFMKGSPSTPKCGFSRTAVAILSEHKIEFSSFDILTDEDVRAELKVYSDWPTYPQLYSNGALVGGLDILKEMVGSGDLKEQLGLN